jgi:hypothetical protein
MLSDQQLRQCKPMFVTPCYGGVAAVNFVRSLLALNNALWERGIAGIVRVTNGDSLVTRARNEAVAEFLATPGLTHLFWIDADVGFTPEQAFRLLRADRDVVAGAYPMKSIYWPDALPAGMTREAFHAHYLRYPVNAARGDQPMPLQVDADHFAEVSEAPTGFMAIRRGVFERMAAELPGLKYTPDGPPDSPHRELHYRFFDTMTEPETNRYLSEDYAFCRRWRDLGGRIYIDMTAKLSHQGIYVYPGDFAATFAAAPHHAVGGTRD